MRGVETCYYPFTGSNEIGFMETLSPSKTPNAKLSWVAAQLRPNMLLKACKNLENQSFEYFAPTRQETVKSGSGFRRLERLLFPGYIFVRCDVGSTDIIALNATAGLSRVVRGISEGPGIIPDGFIEELRRTIQTDRLTDPSLRGGGRIRLIAGTFSGMVGEIMSAGPNGRLRILFEMMAGTRLLSVNRNSVEVQSP